MAEERFIDAPPAGAADWREVWLADRRYRPRRGALLDLIRGFFRRVTGPDAERQRDFNVAMLDMLADIRRDVDALRNDLRGDFTSLQRDMRVADEALSAGLSRIDALIPISAKRNDALIAALDQKIETLAVRMRDITNPLIQTASVERSDFLYRRLEEGLRGTMAEVREAMRPYAERAREHQPVVDIGCGRGEFLALCREAGIDARGFDTNERSVAELARLGFAVEVAGIPSCFDGLENGAVGSILATHVVEHLLPDALFALYAGAARALRRGGLLMIETPNAESLFVSASEFWRDPTHLAPRHPAALTLIAREFGFGIVEIAAVHPFPPGTGLELAADDPPGVRRVVEAINRRLFGPQDFRLVLRKE